MLDIPNWPYFTPKNYVQDDTAHSLSQLNGAAVDVGGTLQKSYSQPSMVANSQARGADIRALSEMTRALDKKVIIYINSL